MEKKNEWIKLLTKRYTPNVKIIDYLFLIKYEVS